MKRVLQRSGENVNNIHGANSGFVEARDGARNGHIGTAMNRTTWRVRDNEFHTIVTWYETVLDTSKRYSFAASAVTKSACLYDENAL
jgi:hypothetical protein